MKKILAIISSSVVCVSAVAVSVLSYFPAPVKVGATAPDTSSLVTTLLGSPSSYPVITFPRELVNQSTDDTHVTIRFCPSGWVSNSDYVSPSSYGAYSEADGYFVFNFNFSGEVENFSVSQYAHFGSGLGGKKLFSNLTLTDVNNDGLIPTQSVHFSSVCPSNSAFESVYLFYSGVQFDSGEYPSDVVFSLTGLIGNDYELWHSSQAYNTGHYDGYNSGYNSGYSDGRTIGHDEGYGVGFNAGKSVGNSQGYASGYEVGVSDGTRNFGMWDLFSNAFGSIGNILSIQLFPGLSVGLLISVPIAFAFILWLIHVLKG